MTRRRQRRRGKRRRVLLGWTTTTTGLAVVRLVAATAPRTWRKRRRRRSGEAHPTSAPHACGLCRGWLPTASSRARTSSTERRRVGARWGRRWAGSRGRTRVPSWPQRASVWQGSSPALALPRLPMPVPRAFNSCSAAHTRRGRHARPGRPRRHRRQGYESRLW